MIQRDNLLGRLNKQYSTMSKGQKRLADYISDHYDKAVFMTAARLGSEVGVSESTTVRFAVQMGYDGCPEFHRALEELGTVSYTHLDVYKRQGHARRDGDRAGWERHDRQSEDTHGPHQGRSRIGAAGRYR